jgi:hypothetical protein
MKQDINLSYKPYTAPYTSLGLEPLSNYYLEMSESMTTKSKYYYVGVAGLELFSPANASIIPVSNQCRCLYTTSNGRTYGVWGKYICEVLATGTLVLVGTILTSSGVVRAVDNSIDTMFVDGQYGYIVDNNNILNQITDVNFPGVLDVTEGPSHCAVIDTFFLANSNNTVRYYWSAPGYQPTAFDSTKPYQLSLWNGLYFGEKIGQSDSIVGMVGCLNSLFVFGKYSTEVHYDNGDTFQTFGRMENAYINIGCGAPDSICSYVNQVFWLSSDKAGTVGIFTADSTFVPRRISTRGLEQRIQEYPDITNCYAFTFAHNGHGYAVFNFPSGTPDDFQPQNTGATWIYDITNDTWARRTHYDQVTGLSYQWRGQFATSNFSKLLMGDNSTNCVYELSGDYYVNDKPDGSGYYQIKRDFTSPNLYFAGKLVTVKEVILNMQQATGLTNKNSAGIGLDPQVQLQVSFDTGLTWTNWVNAPIGVIGGTYTRTRWVGIGCGRNIQFRFLITEPVEVIITGVVINYEVMKE